MTSTKHLHLLTTASMVLFLLVPDVLSVVSKRCQSVCSRSDGQDFCQRCRMRIPMRFGKRMDASISSVSEADDSKKEAAETNEEDESRFDGSMHVTYPRDRNYNIRRETTLLLKSMKMFAKDLEDWERELYDQ